MKKLSFSPANFVIRALALASVVALGACAGSSKNSGEHRASVPTPTVDYVEQLDVYSAPHQDSFLNQLAMNYRSYAIYNARTSDHPDMGELFAQKAIAAFSGELPFPETLGNWPVADENEAFELSNSYNELLEQLKNDAADLQPELAAEAQAKFDCWLSATASEQAGTASECKKRFQKALTTLRDCQNSTIKQACGPMKNNCTVIETSVAEVRKPVGYYPDTCNMHAARVSNRARDGLIVVNNVNVPEHLINPIPVHPMVFNQNIYGAPGKVCTDGDANCTSDEIPMVGDELVTRGEFINMMMSMRSELADINAKLDKIQVGQADTAEKTLIKVQQIPLRSGQRVMEEDFEIYFDFNESTIKPEYRKLIKELADATQANRNIKISIVGHTDTMGSANYNYALGGRRAEAVQKMLMKYGVPASQIVAVSAGEEGLAVKTADDVANAKNRRARITKRTTHKKSAHAMPVMVEVQDVSDIETCGEYGCEK